MIISICNSNIGKCIIFFQFIALSVEDYNHVIPPKPISLLSTEAFYIPIQKEWFPSYVHDESLEYSASLLDLPDLPHWMFSQSHNSSNAFLYGSPEKAGTVYIEIIALNRNTYETASALLELNIHPRDSIFSHEVEIKFLNLNVEDMFRSNRLPRLVDIFRSSLWKEVEDIYVTRVVSSVDAGGRLPLNPNTKEGVVVRVGGGGSFSRDLEDLEREVRPLRNRSPCPRDYKRTSVEHLFRGRNFVADWCSFTLVSAATVEGRSDAPPPPPSLDEWHPLTDFPPPRDLTFDFVVSIVIPTSLVLCISSVVACLMARQPKGSKSPQPDKQVNGGSPSYPESRTDSPGSTLPKGTSLRPSSRTGTLRSVVEPPPYVTHSIGLPAYAEK